MKDFFSKKSVPKPKTQFGGAAWGPWAQAPPKLVLGFGSGFGTNFFDEKSYTKVSDKLFTLTGFDKRMSKLALGTVRNESAASDLPP